MTHHPVPPIGLPGDPDTDPDPDPIALVDRILRVDHAGEYGAMRIYEGQLAVLERKTGRKAAKNADAIRAMAEQERQHLAMFSHLLVQRRGRPTALHPLWHVMAYALGAGTALLGTKAAMACTVAVEEVIDAHYARQIQALGSTEADLRATLEATRQDELGHRDTGIRAGGPKMRGYGLMRVVIGRGCRVAIWLSERV